MPVYKATKVQETKSTLFPTQPLQKINDAIPVKNKLITAEIYETAFESFLPNIDQ